MPFSTAFPDSGSTCDSSASTLLFTPACAEATPIRTPSASWPHPCGIETTPGMISSVTSTGTSIAPDADVDRRVLAVGQPEPLRVVGVHVQRAALLALHERRQVVHPRVVRAQLAPADQDEAAVPLTLHDGPQAFDVADDRLGSQLDLPRRRAQHVGQPRRQRAQVDPVRGVLEQVERQASGVGAEAVAVGARAQQEVEHPLGAAARLQLAEQLRRFASPHRGALASHLALDQRLDDHVVEGGDVAVRALAGRDPRRAA